MRAKKNLKSACSYLEDDYDHFRSSDVGAAHERHIRRHRPSCSSKRNRVRRVHRQQPVVVSPAALREVRAHRLLRYIAQSARDGAFPRDRPFRHDEFRARRGLVLELSHGEAVQWPQARTTAVATSRPALPWTQGSRSRGLGRPAQRVNEGLLSALRVIPRSTKG